MYAKVLLVKKKGEEGNNSKKKKNQTQGKVLLRIIAQRVYNRLRSSKQIFDF
jgi:hypothetical protein